MYQIHDLLKFTEEDIFSDGCQPDTAQSQTINITFRAKTAAEVVQKCADYLGIGGDGIALNACDEKGRVDFTTTEDSDGNNLSPLQWAQFKKGKIRAWNAIYTATVEKVTPAKL